MDRDLDLTWLLPAETLGYVFDSIELTDLVRCSLVSRRWRDIAIQHRMYWSQIYVSDERATRPAELVRASIELGCAQLSRSKAQPISVAVVLHGVYDDAAALMEVIGRNLGRINDLSLQLDASLRCMMFATLSQPAPIMQTLALELFGTANAELQPTFLGGHAPQLNHLAVRNIHVPQTPIPHIQHLPELAVASLHEKTTSGTTPDHPEFPDHIFSVFPDLVQLEVNSYPFFSIPQQPPSRMSAGLLRLQRLHFWSSPPKHLFEWRETKNIDKISIYEPDVRIVPTIVAQLEGDLVFAIDSYANHHQFANFMEARYVTPTLPALPGPEIERLRIRKMIYSSDVCVLRPPLVAAFAVGALDRVTALCIGAMYLSYMCATFPPMNNLRDLVLRVADELYDVEAPMAGAPKLRRFLLDSAAEGGREVVLEADDVVTVIERALPKRVLGQFRIQLNNVRVEGWTDAHFARCLIRRTGCNPWTDHAPDCAANDAYEDPGMPMDICQ